MADLLPLEHLRLQRNRRLPPWGSSQLGFDVGTLINLDVLIALDALFTTRATLYKARYDTILNALRLKAQAAALTNQDLVAVNALLK
jgi:outer membrane protein